MTVHSCVGMAIAGDLTAYEVRTCTKGHAADNKAYVSSKTAGKTHRAAGNLDATWEISLYSPAGITVMPAALKAGQILSVQVPSGAAAEKMIIDSSSLEIDVEAGELVGISLSCSAVDAASYV